MNSFQLINTTFKKAVSVLGTAFLLFATAHAQDNPKVTYLSVYVYDAEENIPVSYATVAIPDLNKFQYTDTEGMLVYRSVPNGTYQLQITRIGYKNSVKAIRLTGDSLFVEIPLQPRPIASETIVIEENRKREYGHEVGDADFNISGEKLDKTSEPLSPQRLMENLEWHSVLWGPLRHDLFCVDWVATG